MKHDSEHLCQLACVPDTNDDFYKVMKIHQNTQINNIFLITA